MNPYFPKRFLSIDAVFKREFGAKTVKIPLNAGFSCPNRDGTKGRGGCIYCSDSLSGDFAQSSKMSIAEQFEREKSLYLNKWGVTKYIAYFQAGTNTYAPTERLREVYREALCLEGVVGLSIATRADCISGETADMLAELSRITYLTVELGLQSSHDKTAEKINRCHSYADFLSGYSLLKKRGVRACIHIINGLPGEGHDDMMKTVRDVAALKPYEIKIHLMHIIRGTPAQQLYLSGELVPLEKEEYISLVCDQLEILPPGTAIGRLTGDGDKRVLVAPDWSLNKRSVLNGIDKELKRRDSYQGIRYVG